MSSLDLGEESGDPLQGRIGLVQFAVTSLGDEECWNRFMSAVRARSVLERVTWVRRRAAAEEVSLERLHCRFLPSDSAEFANARVKENWYRSPFGHVLLVNSTKEAHFLMYTAARVREWVHQRRASESEWIVLYLPPVDDESNPAVRAHQARSRTITFEKLKQACNAPDSPARVIRVDFPVAVSRSPGTERSRTDPWRPFFEKLSHCISGSLTKYTERYEMELAQLEEAQRGPLSNFGPFFVQKEGLAFLFAQVRLFKDALRIYNELEQLYFQCVAQSALPPPQAPPRSFSDEELDDPDDDGANADISSARNPRSVGRGSGMLSSRVPHSSSSSSNTGWVVGPLLKESDVVREAQVLGGPIDEATARMRAGRARTASYQAVDPGAVPEWRVLSSHDATANRPTERGSESETERQQPPHHHHHHHVLDLSDRPYRALLQRNQLGVFFFRRYLFARTIACAILARDMGQVLATSDRLLQFAGGYARWEVALHRASSEQAARWIARAALDLLREATLLAEAMQASLRKSASAIGSRRATLPAPILVPLRLLADQPGRQQQEQHENAEEGRQRQDQEHESRWQRPERALAPWVNGLLDEEGTFFARLLLQEIIGAVADPAKVQQSALAILETACQLTHWLRTTTMPLPESEDRVSGAPSTLSTPPQAASSAATPAPRAARPPSANKTAASPAGSATNSPSSSSRSSLLASFSSSAGDAALALAETDAMQGSWLVVALLAGVANVAQALQLHRRAQVAQLRVAEELVAMGFATDAQRVLLRPMRHWRTVQWNALWVRAVRTWRQACGIYLSDAKKRQSYAHALWLQLDPRFPWNPSAESSNLLPRWGTGSSTAKEEPEYPTRLVAAESRAIRHSLCCFLGGGSLLRWKSPADCSEWDSVAAQLLWRLLRECRPQTGAETSPYRAESEESAVASDGSSSLRRSRSGKDGPAAVALVAAPHLLTFAEPLVSSSSSSSSSGARLVLSLHVWNSLPVAIPCDSIGLFFRRVDRERTRTGAGRNSGSAMKAQLSPSVERGIRACGFAPTDVGSRGARGVSVSLETAVTDDWTTIRCSTSVDAPTTASGAGGDDFDGTDAEEGSTRGQATGAKRFSKSWAIHLPTRLRAAAIAAAKQSTTGDDSIAFPQEEESPMTPFSPSLDSQSPAGPLGRVLASACSATTTHSRVTGGLGSRGIAQWSQGPTHPKSGGKHIGFWDRALTELGLVHADQHRQTNNADDDGVEDGPMSSPPRRQRATVRIDSSTSPSVRVTCDRMEETDQGQYDGMHASWWLLPGRNHVRVTLPELDPALYQLLLVRWTWGSLQWTDTCPRVTHGDQTASSAWPLAASVRSPMERTASIVRNAESALRVVDVGPAGVGHAGVPEPLVFWGLQSFGPGCRDDSAAQWAKNVWKKCHGGGRSARGGVREARSVPPWWSDMQHAPLSCVVQVPAAVAPVQVSVARQASMQEGDHGANTVTIPVRVECAPGRRIPAIRILVGGLDGAEKNGGDVDEKVQCEPPPCGDVPFEWDPVVPRAAGQEEAGGEDEPQQQRQEAMPVAGGELKIANSDICGSAPWNATFQVHVAGWTETAGARSGAVRLALLLEVDEALLAEEDPLGDQTRVRVVSIFQPGMDIPVESPREE